jgi:hypothetical protein
MTDFGKAFSFPFREPDWGSKFVIGALVLMLCLFGIGIPVIVGYMIRVTQRVMSGEEHILPEWSDLGVMFVTGFKFCVVYAIYLLPVMAMLVPMAGLAIIAGATNTTSAFDLLLAVYAFGMILIMVPYSLFLQAVSPIIAYRFARRERISDALNVRTLFRDFRANWQNTVVVALIAIGIESFAAVGLLFFLVGILFTLLYTYLVSAYLHGLVYLSLPDHAREEWE